MRLGQLVSVHGFWTARVVAIGWMRVCCRWEGGGHVIQEWLPYSAVDPLR